MRHRRSNPINLTRSMLKAKRVEVECISQSNGEIQLGHSAAGAIFGRTREAVRFRPVTCDRRRSGVIVVDQVCSDGGTSCVRARKLTFHCQIG